MFELIGYYKEYWIENKFLGTLSCEKDRDEIGYAGRKKEILSEQIVLQNKRKIKAGTEVMTYLYPLNGKRIISQVIRGIEN